MMRWPPPLTAGSRIALVAPARSVTFADIAPFLEFAGQQGWKVLYDERLFAQHGILAGKDDVRRTALQEALDSPEIQAVWFARGGHGVSRLWSALSWEGLQRYPKWLIGFSDTTPLLWGAAKAGIIALHAPLAAQVPHRLSTSAIDSLLFFLRSERFDYTLTWRRRPSYAWQIGTAYGPLLGGNLSLLQTLCGTPLDLRTWPHKPILFWEEVGEALYRIDRSLAHLRNAGWYAHTAALLVGSITTLIEDETNPLGFSPREVAQADIPPHLPVAMGLPLGHIREHHALPIGAWCHLQIQENTAYLRLWRS